ncbi:MAG: hypothetical protein LBK53_04905 [Heliobacteriaceae bacterium]|jgi:hypothetical protein|nr:hypothetical protein [Heliobacteriaceae bacterium]
MQITLIPQFNQLCSNSQCKVAFGNNSPVLKNTLKNDTISFSGKGKKRKEELQDGKLANEIRKREQKFSSSEGIDTQVLLENSNKRAGLLPLSIYDSFYYVRKYISGVTLTDNFVSLILDGMPILNKRIYLCKDSEEYQENYEHEIEMIETIVDACSEYKERSSAGEITRNDKKNLDLIVENSVLKYIDTPNTRKREFDF